MLTKQDILSFLRENKEYLRKHFHLTKVGIFGSFARDEQKQDSDIDILIEMEDETKNIFDLKWELREYFKKQFNREVDICGEKYIKPYAKAYILKDAIYILARFIELPRYQVNLIQLQVYFIVSISHSAIF